MSNFVRDAKELMELSGKVSLIKVKRDENRVAHGLAHHALRGFSSAVCLAGVPSCIEHFMLEDCIASLD